VALIRLAHVRDRWRRGASGRHHDAGIVGLGDAVEALRDRMLDLAGLEVRHEENLREHYAKTCHAWCDNLDAHCDEAVREVGQGTARVWALYLVGSWLGSRTTASSCTRCSR
jgi:cyclopropane fatty-acyl-phospholipid synthase-like methyltransferase